MDFIYFLKFAKSKLKKWKNFEEDKKVSIKIYTKLDKFKLVQLLFMI